MSARPSAVSVENLWRLQKIYYSEKSRSELAYVFTSGDITVSHQANILTDITNAYRDNQSHVLCMPLWLDEQYISQHFEMLGQFISLTEKEILTRLNACKRKERVEMEKKIFSCIVRESNPGRPRGRRAFYHWTNDAQIKNTGANSLIEQMTPFVKNPCVEKSSVMHSRVIKVTNNGKTRKELVGDVARRTLTTCKNATAP